MPSTAHSHRGFSLDTGGADTLRGGVASVVAAIRAAWVGRQRLIVVVLTIVFGLWLVARPVNQGDELLVATRANDIMADLEHVADTSVQAAADANTAFAADLFEAIRDSHGAQPRNVFFSPMSVTSALGMTMAGARGRTLDEMRQALRARLSADDYHPALSKLLRSFGLGPSEGTGQAGVHLAVANRLWVADRFSLLPAFTSLTSGYYHAGAELCHFATNAEGERSRINHWIEQKTNQRIQNLLPPGSLKANTQLVLTNAIYFKGDWVNAFDPQKTESAPFRRFDGNHDKVPLMHQHERVGYTHMGNVAALNLPYGKKDKYGQPQDPEHALSMLVLLPDDSSPRGLQNAVKLLHTAELERLSQQLDEVKVKVWLPRFRLEESLGLTSLLQQLGMRDAFTGSADFSGIGGTLGLYISEVLHKAFVQVNEEGTEAAAATAVLMMRSAFRPMPDPEFRADRPFVFAIWHRQSRSVLFVGQCIDPQAAA